MEANREDAFNVMVLTTVIVVVVIALSIFALAALTHNLYLDSYFTLEAFFDAQNTAASTELASLAFSEGLSQLVPIVLIVAVDNLSRILIVSFIIAAVLDFLTYANVEQIINTFKARGLKNHVIICGYNDIADRLIKRLREQHTSYLLIDPRRGMDAEFAEKKLFGIVGDFANEELLKNARIERASAIAFVSNSDVSNVAAALVARRLNPNIKILLRLAEEGVRKEVYQIGADMAVIPEHLAGIEIGEYVTRSVGA
ncbi:MAG: NAD-binding protein [Candidatus Micrarchaeota archaeon]|nr:NAD-binding protein [Candidatus Micrarchaeota archaeon]